MNNDKPTVAVLGLGIMGQGMASNFLKAGHPTVVWNRHQDKAKDLLEAGATLAKTPAEATEQADLVIEIVADDEASHEVWAGDDGILSVAKPEQILITSASLSIRWTDKLAELCADQGLRFLDIPVTGSRWGAESGELQLLAGGEEAVLEEARPTLEAIAKKLYHIGRVGSGMRFKLILNGIQAVHNLAAAEAMHLAEGVGISKERAAAALLEMGPSSPVTKLVFERMATQSDKVNFAVKWIAKDLVYAETMAADVQMNMPLLSEASWAFGEADAYDEVRDLDWTELYRFMNYEVDEEDFEE